MPLPPDTLSPAAVHPPPADTVTLQATRLESGPVGLTQRRGGPGHRWEGRENEKNNDMKGAMAGSCRVARELCIRWLGLLGQSTPTEPLEQQECTVTQS